MITHQLILHIQEFIQSFRNKSKSLHVISLGYPSTLIDSSIKMPIESQIPKNAFDLDTIKRAQQHGIHLSFYDIKKLIDVYYNNNCILDILDNSISEQPTIIWDLNIPIPEDFYQRYDILIDSGTHEHVFNIGISLLNAANLIKKDGYIIGALPLYSPNHGYYNINPNCLVELFSPGNGYELKKLSIEANSSPLHLLANKSTNKYQLFSEEFSNNLYTNLCDFIQNNSVSYKQLSTYNTLYYVAKRVALLPITPPMQHKYKRMVGRTV